MIVAILKILLAIFAIIFGGVVITKVVAKFFKGKS